MRETQEIKIFLILVNFFLVIFIAGIFYFVFMYRKRKREHDHEKQLLQEQHRLVLATTQSEIQQQTMQDIGRELHDNIGQQLTLASIYTQQLQHEQENDRLVRISNIINESLAGLRQLSKTLTDPALEQNTLHELVQREAGKVNALGRCVFTLQSGIDALYVGYNTKVFVLRILQEFIQNSLKHSQCKNILADIQLNDSGLLLKMVDDGEGFSTAGQETAGIGLDNMKKRADLLGAQFSLTSTPGTGTELVLVIPASQIKQ